MRFFTDEISQKDKDGNLTAKKSLIRFSCFTDSCIIKRMWNLKMKDYWVQIASIHKDQEGCSDKIEFSTSAKGIMREDHFHVAYQESEISGMEGVLTRVDIFSDRVILNRSGNVTQKMEFEIGGNKDFEYETPYGKLLFKVNTKEIKVDKDKEMVHLIELIYKLLDGEDRQIGECQLSLSIQEAKE